MRAILFAAFALAACASTEGGGWSANATAATHPRRSRAARGGAARAGRRRRRHQPNRRLGNGLRVRPLEVLEDSRCPQNARCVWAGRLRLRVNVEGVGEREITAEETDAVQTPRGSFTLVAISPGPWTDWPQERRPPYRFGFKRGCAHHPFPGRCAASNPGPINTERRG